LTLHSLEDAEKVLDFWFGALINKTDFPEDKASMWFVHGSDYDEVIRSQFLPLHNQACSGKLDVWCDVPRSMLALVIILDQFSRHIYRHQKQSFAQDEKAVATVLKGIDNKLDRDLFFVERKFFYMPLMHAENIDIQNLSVEMFSRLRDEVPHESKALYEKSLSFAQSHHYVISKFGRFPELNEILNRKSSAEEQEFLDTGKYRFL
tara:strand:- start:41754 stop:42371 length:618 start_codon:yes stop_codon:yes gene_type:complete